ncbi:MAG: recombinase family protein [Pseudomonadota bacterium]
MKKLGYLRVSTQEQRPDRQIDGLAGICDELFIETVSAAAPRRPVYDHVIAQLGPGDGLVVWHLDRAFRSTVDAILEVEKLKARDITLEIVDLQVDTATASGMRIYSVIAAFAEFERRMLSQRTKEGLAAARARGKRLGRPPKLSEDDLAIALHRIETRGCRLRDIAESFDVAPWTLRRALNRRAEEEPHRKPPDPRPDVARPT